MNSPHAAMIGMSLIDSRRLIQIFESLLAELLHFLSIRLWGRESTGAALAPMRGVCVDLLTELLGQQSLHMRHVGQRPCQIAMLRVALLE